MQLSRRNISKAPLVFVACPSALRHVLEETGPEIRRRRSVVLGYYGQRRVCMLAVLLLRTATYVKPMLTVRADEVESRGEAAVERSRSEGLLVAVITADLSRAEISRVFGDLNRDLPDLRGLRFLWSDTSGGHKGRA